MKKIIILILFVAAVLLAYVSADLLISNPTPSNNSVLPSGTTSATLAVETDINANCKYWPSSGQDFSSMTSFTNTGELSHNSTISGLQDAQSYDYYIKCQNISNLTDITDDYQTHFFVLDYALEQCFPNQLGYWTFDHFNNNIVYDITGDNYASTYGGVTSSQPGQIGQSFAFNGEDGYIDVNNLEGVLPDSSFGFWITPNQDYGPGSGQTAPVVLLNDGLTEIFIDTDGIIKETYDGATITSSPPISWTQGQSYHILKTPSKFYLGTSGGCQISEAFNWSEANPEEIAPGSSVNLAVDNGCPPFNWTVSGTGFSLDTEIGSAVTNRLNASGSACGSAAITVIDSLGQNVTGYVISTAGQCISCGNVSIGYTTQQMAVNEEQTLTVEGAVNGTDYNWEITSGGGSLSSATGLSVDYTAPSTNANCDSNPSISLSVGGIVCDTRDIAVNQYSSSLAIYVITECILIGPTGQDCLGNTNPYAPHYLHECCMKAYNCDGSFNKDSYYTLCHSSTPTGCGEDWCATFCDIGAVTDVRSEAMKSGGCCPLALHTG